MARWKRTVLYVAGGLMAALVLVIAALPLWLPWALAPVAGRFGLVYDDYARDGYHSFVLRDVRYTSPAATLQASEVKGFLPTAWLWHLWRGNADVAYVRVEGWELRLLERPDRPDRQTSPYAAVEAVESILEPLRAWLPLGRLNDGVIHAREQSIHLPRAVWDRGNLTADLAAPAYEQSAVVRAELGASEPYRIAVDSESLNVRSVTEVSREPDGLRLETRAEWLNNPIQASAQFDREGVLPERAVVEAESFTIPAALLKLPEYEDLQGSFSFRWGEQRFQLALSAAAAPGTNQNYPAIALELRAGGHTNAAVIEAMELTAPGIDVALSESAPIQFTPPFLTGESTVTFAVDLSEQPWLEAAGKIIGEAVLGPGAEYPAAVFSISGSEITAATIQVERVALSGQFRFPWLELRQATLRFFDGSMAVVDAGFDARERVLRDGVVEFQGPFGRQWLPAEATYDSANLHLRFHGPLTNINHSGKLEVHGFRGPRLQPLDLETSWTGAQLALEQIQIQTGAGQSAVMAQASLDLNANRKTLEVNRLELRTNQAPVLELRSPFEVTFDPAAQGTRQWAIQMQPLHLTGGQRAVRLEADLAWPQQGRVRAAVQGIDLGLFRDFHTLDLPEAEVEDLQFMAGWTNGPAQFQLAFAGEVLVTNGLPLRAEAKLMSAGEGVTIETLSVFSEEQPVIDGHGFLPLIIRPDAPDALVTMREDEPLRLQFAAQPDEAFWNRWAEWVGLRLRRPAIHLELAGTWPAPRGELTARIDEIRLLRSDRELPPLENLQLRASLTREGMILDQLRFLVLEQPVSLQGQWPLDETAWTERQLDWREATARLRIEEARLEAVAAYFPELLSPQGELSAEVDLLRGGTLAGSLSLRNAATRPLPSLGAVRDINAQVNIHDRRIELDRLVATLGGQPIEVTGAAELPEALWPGDSLPVFQVRVRGANLPLARRPEIILRADLDLSITNSPAAPPPVITGLVTLQNSYFVSELGDLLPGRVARPTQRPPYFSIEAEPFADWRLNLRVEGNEFLKVRSPLFRGDVSTTLNLEGTLREPVALGEARVAEGRVRFPFATFRVTEGLVSLTSEHLYQPQLFVTGTAQRLGYDLSMEVTGSADAPVIQFSSSPPLTPEQILLMVTTGQAPTQAGQLTSGQRAQRLGFFLGRNLLADLGIGGGDEERLSVQTGEQVTAGGRPTYEVEYKLTDRWSVVGEYDRFNDFNVGLRWNIFER